MTDGTTNTETKIVLWFSALQNSNEKQILFFVWTCQVIFISKQLSLCDLGKLFNLVKATFLTLCISQNDRGLKDMLYYYHLPFSLVMSHPSPDMLSAYDINMFCQKWNVYTCTCIIFFNIWLFSERLERFLYILFQLERPKDILSHS